MAVGKAPPLSVKVIAAHVSGYLHLTTDTLAPWDLPREAYDSKRHQYNAAHLLKAFESKPLDTCGKVIAVFDVDIFVPIFTHVFGEAMLGGKVALVSLYRLGKAEGSNTPEFSTVLERAAKIALHELGHLFNVMHCTDERCLMRFAGNLDDLDRIPFQFCRYCTTFLEDATHAPAFP
ncbi:MAG: zinc metallopeptidase [Deltaproteobacteria bacterium]|nr:zinc metallopeptidase [Deltaproteobacteria bacterium]